MQDPKTRHLGTCPQLCRAISLQLRHISTIGKKLLSSNVSSTCPHNMVSFGPLTAEICSGVWGTPANFIGFCVLAALLHGALVVGVSQTLRRWTEGATYIRQGGHHVGHWPTFLVVNLLRCMYARNYKNQLGLTKLLQTNKMVQVFWLKVMHFIWQNVDFDFKLWSTKNFSVITFMSAVIFEPALKVITKYLHCLLKGSV